MQTNCKIKKQNQMQNQNAKPNAKPNAKQFKLNASTPFSCCARLDVGPARLTGGRREPQLPSPEKLGARCEGDTVDTAPGKSGTGGPFVPLLWHRPQVRIGFVRVASNPVEPLNLKRRMA